MTQGNDTVCPGWLTGGSGPCLTHMAFKAEGYPLACWGHSTLGLRTLPDTARNAARLTMR